MGEESLRERESEVSVTAEGSCGFVYIAACLRVFPSLMRVFYLFLLIVFVFVYLVVLRWSFLNIFANWVSF